MNPFPTRFYPPFLTEPRTRIPARVRNGLGRLLLGPPRGRRRRQQRTCVLALGRIGDFVLSLSAFRLFAREFGADQLTLVVPRIVTPLAAVELPGVELITLPPEASGLVREILPLWWRDRKQFAGDRFARRITLNHFRSFWHEMAWSWIDAQADFRLGPETYPPAPRDGQSRELQAHQRVTALVLGRDVGWDEIVPRFTRFPVSNDNRLLVYPLSQESSRSLPAGKVVSILRHWRTRSRAPIVLGGSPRDLAELERYATAARTAGVDGLTVETPAGILGLIGQIGAAGALLAADSAAGHIGIAFDKPTVVLVSQAWFGLSQPWHRSTRQRTFVTDAPDPDIAAALPAW